MKTLLVALIGLSFLSGCGTIAKSKELVSYVHKQKVELEALVSKGQVAVDERLDKMEAQSDETTTKLANVGIALDADGDGKVSPGEGTKAIISLAKGAITDGEKRDLLTDPKTIGGVASSILLAIIGNTGLSRRRRKKEQQDADAEELDRLRKQAA